MINAHTMFISAMSGNNCFCSLIYTTGGPNPIVVLFVCFCSCYVCLCFLVELDSAPSNLAQSGSLLRSRLWPRFPFLPVPSHSPQTKRTLLSTDFGGRGGSPERFSLVPPSLRASSNPHLHTAPWVLFPSAYFLQAVMSRNEIRGGL